MCELAILETSALVSVILAETWGNALKLLMKTEPQQHQHGI